ncbi:MAG TPA: dihydrolipoamide acetyltransferase family protein, partial [Acidimicrobiales bacterium]|nr:dihydrolipoamide acetyltransferase family protein [Acidimicrobiales bacterium]
MARGKTGNRGSRMAEPKTAASSVDVRMPQMGETVTEGTITAWLKSPGDEIAVDEPLLEISTDKVDSEIPSPVAGVVAEVLVPEGDTVPIGELIARITVDGGGASADDTPAAPSGAADPPPASRLRSGAKQLGERATTATPAERQRSSVTTFLSPAVRRLVDEHGVDPATIDGSGRDGRVTRDDVLALVQSTPPAADRPGVRHVPFTAIRRTIGRNLVQSLATAAHTLVVVEVDYARVAPVKERTGTTWLPFIARAAVDALAEFPLVNAHVSPEGLDVHDAVHLGIAVDLDFEGLVVPVLRDAERLRLPALAEALAERARAARDHTLAADDYAGGTFTLTNAGRYGTLLTAPIINQPQAAILSTDGVKVRPVALPLPDGGHGLAFHPVGNLALSFDHRAFDGAYASAFAARVRDVLEQRD